MAHAGSELNTAGFVLMDWISVITLAVCSRFWQHSFIFGLYDISIITASFIAEFINVIVSEKLLLLLVAQERSERRSVQKVTNAKCGMQFCI